MVTKFKHLTQKLETGSRRSMQIILFSTSSKKYYKNKKYTQDGLLTYAR